MNDIVGEERLVVDESERRPPHKVDENMWKNREHMEEIIFLLDRARWPQAVSVCLLLNVETVRFGFLWL